MRILAFIFALTAGLSCAATLERLTLDDMIAKSTEIVRAKVVAVGTVTHGSLIYTRYTIEVSNRWKGDAKTREDVYVPGGVAQGIRQTFSGAPALDPSQDYMMFLWSGKRGIVQLIGLSQGLLQLRADLSGQMVAYRAASNEPMIDASGNLVPDQPSSMRLSDLDTHIQQQLTMRGGK